MSAKNAINIALVTVAVMFAANQLAALDPTARKLLKGASVSGVGSGATGTWM